MKNLIKAIELEYHYQRMLIDCGPSRVTREGFIELIVDNWLDAPKGYYIGRYRN